MANIVLTITLKGLNISKTIPAFLRDKPMPQVPTPGWVEGVDPGPAPMVDKYPSVKKWAEARGREFFKECIERGWDLLNKDAAPALLAEKDIFVVD